MLKTPPRIAALGIALTIVAIGTGNLLNAKEVAEAPDFFIEEFDADLTGLGVTYVLPEAPVAPELQQAC